MAAEFVQRGRSCVEQGQLQEAVRVCRLGLLANPGEIEGRLVLGTALVALARFDEVLAEMKYALDMEPRNPSALALKGEALLRKGDAPQAVSILERASQIAPGDPYVEQLQAEASAAEAAGFKASQTYDIDPELEGVEIRDEAGGFADPTQVQDDDIEMLDDDLLMEATPTPMPQQGLEGRDDAAVAAAAMAALDESLDSPFADAPGQGEFSGDGLETPIRVRPPLEAPAPPFSAPDPMGPFSAPEPAAAPQSSRPQTIGTLFPEDESGVSGLEVVDSQSGFAQPVPKQPGGDRPLPELGAGELAYGLPPGRSMTADMHLIREGLNEQAEGGSVGPRSVSMAAEAPAEQRREPSPPPKKRRRRRLPLVVWFAIALLVVAAGLFGGFKIRDARLARQIHSAQVNARKLASRDTYLGYRKARDMYSRVLKVRESDMTRAALARAEAALAAEFGDSPSTAAAMLNKLDDPEQLDALAATTYLAIANGDKVAARESAALLVKDHADKAVSHYLMGRSKLLDGDAEAAIAALGKALELGPGPLTYVALARAEALRGGYPEALAAIERATQSAPNHPTALIWRAQIISASGNLPKDESDPDEELAQLIGQTRRGSVEEDSLSATQGAWAGLVLADIKLQRGDTAAAKKALAEAKVGRPSDWMFSDMLADILIRLGDMAAARTEAERAMETWPRRSKPRIVVALVSLLEGNPEQALETLEDVESIETSAEALAVRGRARLRLGKLDEAAADLDGALALRSRYSDAVIARARVDILRGDAKAAIGRLEPMYDRTASVVLSVAYAAALRMSGKSERAREVLEPISGEGGNVIALIELAKLERSEGRFEQARSVFQRAIEMNPRSLDARLGAALLDIDDGRTKSGRESLDVLIEEGTNNGLVLVEAARARTLTGDSDGAKLLLDRAAKNSAWLGWNIARERGRILLRRQTPIEAISELQRAQSLRPEDVETRVLLVEAHFEARNKRGAGRALQDITKTFRDAPVRQIAAGINALLNERSDDAVAAFNEARSLLIDQKGSRMELANVAYWLGRSFEVSGDLRQAAQWLDKATKLNKAFAGAHYWLGQIHHMNEKPSLMAASYEKAVELDPGNNPLAWFFLGTHYARVGKKARAVKALESFLRYYPDDSGDVVVEAKTLLGQLR